MSEKKYVVPDAMLDAAIQSVREYLEQTNVLCLPELHVGTARVASESAIRWQSEHPVVPTDEQMDCLLYTSPSPRD